LVVGAPGAGKTTYCEGMRQYLSALGREPAIINLDPATTSEATFDIDITELVSIEGVMSEMKLGPNGAMIYCLEYLNENVDWLLRKLEELPPHK
jgi:GPN-loop GTPase